MSPKRSITELLPNACMFGSLALWMVCFFWMIASSPSSQETAHSEKDASGVTDVNASAEANAGEVSMQFELGDMARKYQEEAGFTYPETLDAVHQLAVEKHGGWKTNKMVDPYGLMYEFFQEGASGKSIEEAAKLRNDSPENNREIIAAYQALLDRSKIQDNQDSPEVDYSAELNFHTSADKTSFNQFFFNSSTDQDIWNYLQPNLLINHPKTMEYFGNSDVIVSWESSADNMIDKIVMRDDLVWSDGTPLTAYDWEFSYQAIMTSMVPIFAIRSSADLLMGVKAYDERTIVFFHKESMPINGIAMSYPIIAKHIYADSISEDPTLTTSPKHQQLEHHPVTAGLYEVEDYSSRSFITLRRRENYHTVNGKQVRSKPFFNRVHFKILEEPATAFMQLLKGDVELMQLTVDQSTTQAATPRFYELNTKAEAPSWTYFAFWFNLSEECPFFHDIRVRKALSYAFDYQELLDVHQKGVSLQCRGIYAETSPYFPHDANLPYIRQDVEKARALLKEAGWEDTDNDGLLDHEWKGSRIPFKFTIITTTNKERFEMCQLLAKCLYRLGISCSVQQMEFNVQSQRMQAHKFEMAFSGWGGGSDPYSGENIWGTDAGRNHIFYSNPEVDRLYKEGICELDIAKRQKIYQKIHQLIYEDYPCIWLYNRNSIIGFNKKLHGIGFTPRDYYFQDSWKAAAQVHVP